MATWPTTLLVNRRNYTEEPPDRVLRTSMEAGVDKLRRRTTNAVRRVKFKLFLTDALVETLDAFYLANDSLQFDFTDPRTDDAVKARFVTNPKYAYSETMWDVDVELEILP